VLCFSANLEGRVELNKRRTAMRTTALSSTSSTRFLDIPSFRPCWSFDAGDRYGSYLLFQSGYFSFSIWITRNARMASSMACRSTWPFRALRQCLLPTEDSRFGGLYSLRHLRRVNFKERSLKLALPVWECWIVGRRREIVISHKPPVPNVFVRRLHKRPTPYRRGGESVMTPSV
jgi:hypothetical protein